MSTSQPRAAMAVAWAALRAIVVASMACTVSGIIVPCPAGTRVYSLSVWSGHWLDGLLMRCTGDGNEETIPTEFNESPGGEEGEDICGGTAGVKSLEWAIPGTYGHHMVYVNVTCLDDQTYHFANGSTYEGWNIISTQHVTCDEGQHVEGLTYITEESEGDDWPYFLVDVGFRCSSSPLDPICTECSGDTTPLSDEETPEYCDLPSCTEAECCESDASSEESASITTDVVIGVMSTVVAAMIISGAAWTCNKFRKSNASKRSPVHERESVPYPGDGL